MVRRSGEGVGLGGDTEEKGVIYATKKTRRMLFGRERGSSLFTVNEPGRRSPE